MTLRINDVRESTVYIYGLCDPDGQIRYVGKSQTPKLRYRSHFSTGASHSVREWIEWLRESGDRPSLVILETVRPGGDAGKAEIDWLTRLRRGGSPVLNLHRYPEPRETYAGALVTDVRRPLFPKREGAA